MKGFCDGISYYTEYRASIRVFFPEGREVCQYCPFLRHEDAFNRFFCKATPATQYNWILSPERERPGWCPLVPRPREHRSRRLNPAENTIHSERTTRNEFNCKSFPEVLNFRFWRRVLTLPCVMPLLTLGSNTIRLSTTMRRKSFSCGSFPERKSRSKGEMKPRAISETYTNSLGEKANLRKMLENWRGRAFTQEEMDGFDLRNVLGKACMISVVHGTKATALRTPKWEA